MTPTPTFEGILQEFRQLANPQSVEGQQSFAICGGEPLGGSLPGLRRMARGAWDYELAQDLWRLNVPEARLLATMVDDPRQVTADQINEWTAPIQLQRLGLAKTRSKNLTPNLEMQSP
jgi:hypothetical protein